MDGIYRQICCPRPESEDQEMFWSRHKPRHSIQFLAVVTPDDMILWIFGLYELKRGD